MYFTMCAMRCWTGPAPPGKRYTATSLRRKISELFALLLLLNIKDFHHPSQIFFLLFHKFATIISFLGLAADIQIFMFRFGHCSQSTVSIFSPELSQRHPGWEVFGGAQQWRDLQMECVSCERAAHENRARHFHNSLRVVKLET